VLEEQQMLAVRYITWRGTRRNKLRRRKEMTCPAESSIFSGDNRISGPACGLKGSHGDHAAGHKPPLPEIAELAAEGTTRKR